MTQHGDKLLSQLGILALLCVLSDLFRDPGLKGGIEVLQLPPRVAFGGLGID